MGVDLGWGRVRVHQNLLAYKRAEGQANRRVVRRERNAPRS
jgi:hypothetical protein